MLSWHVAHIIATQLVPARCPSTHTSPRCVPPTTASRVHHAARCSAFGRRVAAVACIAEWAFRRYDVELFQRIEELLGRKMDECAAAPPTSAPGLDTLSSHLHRGCAHQSATSAPGLDTPVPHLHRGCAHQSATSTDWAHPCHICTATEAHPCHICTALRSDTTGDSRARLVVRLWRSGLRRYKADSECVMLLSERVNEANRVAVMVAPATPIMAPRSVHNDIPMNQHWLRLRCSCDSGAAWAHPYCGRR
jgi:hypothetical protein